MAEKETEGVGLAPSEYEGGTGLMSDVDVEWTTVRFEEWTYPGGKVTVTAMHPIFEEEDGTVHDTDYFSVGAKSGLEPSEDGTALKKDGSKDTPGAIHPDSNMAHLITSLIEAGFPEDRIGNDAQIFEGLKTHLIRIPAPKRAGVKKAPRPDGRVFEDTILVVDSITQLPWEKEKKGKKAAAKGKKATTTEDKGEEGGDDDDAVEAKAIGLVLEILADHDKGLEKKKLAQLVFAKLNKDKDPDRNAVVGLLYTEEFLGSEDVPWDFADGVVGG